MAVARRRANGEGTVNERADGRWEARWTSTAGKRRSAYGKTRAEARRKMQDERAQEQRGLRPLDRESTVAKFLTDWLDQHVRPNHEALTWQDYRSSVKVHFIPAIGHLRLDQVTPAVVGGAVAKWRGQGYSEGQVWKLRATLQAAFSWAVSMRLVSENPVKPVKTPRTRPRVEANALMTEEEVAAFCRAIRGDRDEGAYLLGLLLGLRRGEVLGLSWHNVDLEAREARVVQQVQRNTGVGLVIKDLKTGPKGNRTVPLPPRLVPVLEARREFEEADRKVAGDRWRYDWDERGLVFRSRLGTPLEGNRLRDRFLRTLARTGLSHRRFHDLRHNAATVLFGQGVSPKLVQELLGHSSIGITMDTYTHVPKGALAAAIGGLDRLLE